MDPLAALSLIPGIGPYVPLVVLAWPVVGLIATRIPHPAAPTGWYAVLHAIINAVALNFGKAANKP